MKCIITGDTVQSHANFMLSVGHRKESVTLTVRVGSCLYNSPLKNK